MRRATAEAVAAVVLLVPFAACDRSTSAPAGPEILVFAAASLTEPFSVIGDAVERVTGARVRFNFGPSDGLATGIVNGAPADVFASAGSPWMDAVAEGPGVVDRTDFARNRLTVIVPNDNPAAIVTFADIAKPDVKLVLASAGVPAGTYARRAIAAAGLEAALRNVVSNEEDVKGVVQKVLLGEADAGIVYVTDVAGRAAEAVRAVQIPDAVNVSVTFPIAAVRTSGHLAAARAFIAYVLGDGRATLRRAGFAAP